MLIRNSNLEKPVGNHLHLSKNFVDLFLPIIVSAGNSVGD